MPLGVAEIKETWDHAKNQYVPPGSISVAVDAIASVAPDADLVALRATVNEIIEALKKANISI